MRTSVKGKHTKRRTKGGGREKKATPLEGRRETDNTTSKGRGLAWLIHGHERKEE